MCLYVSVSEMYVSELNIQRIILVFVEVGGGPGAIICCAGGTGGNYLGWEGAQGGPGPLFGGWEGAPEVPGPLFGIVCAFSCILPTNSGNPSGVTNALR